MTEISAFELSRAYAAGWNAAKRSGSDGPEGASNPYAEGEAHTRWAEGYRGAQDSRGPGAKMKKSPPRTAPVQPE